MAKSGGARRRGSITKKEPGKWLVRVDLGVNPATGARERINKVVAGTKADAEKVLTQLLRQLDSGGLVATSKEPLGAWIEEWLRDWSKDNRERTREWYRWMAGKYLPTHLAAKPLEKLMPGDVQRWVNSLSERGLAPRSVRAAHSMLRAALNRAVRIGKVQRNVASLVELPKQQRREMRALNPDEARRLLAAVAEERMGALIRLLVTTGLRPSEALALRWDDLRDDTLYVQRSITRPKGGGWRFTEPKTNKARRAIPLDQETLDALRRHGRRQAEARLRAGPEYQTHGLIFATEIGTPFDLGTVRERFLRPALERAGLGKLRLYDLRHTHATLPLAMGESIEVVSERLGHSSVALTMDLYQHVSQDMQRELAAKLGALLSTPSTAGSA